MIKWANLYDNRKLDHGLFNQKNEYRLQNKGSVTRNNNSNQSVMNIQPTNIGGWWLCPDVMKREPIVI